MKKKELYRKIVDEITLIDVNRFNYSDSFRAGEAAGKINGLESAKKLLNQLDEPELPVIPQFIADWIQICIACKHNLYGVYNFAPEKASNWIFGSAKKKERTELVARAWLDGYEVEKELEPPRTRQVLVKFFDNEEYRTELTEDAARELIEFLEAKQNE